MIRLQKANKMSIQDIKDLIIKLDIAIDAEHNKTNGQGLALLFDFTEDVRKQSIVNALDKLTKLQEQLGEE